MSPPPNARQQSGITDTDALEKIMSRFDRMEERYDRMEERYDQMGKYSDEKLTEIQTSLASITERSERDNRKTHEAMQGLQRKQVEDSQRITQLERIITTHEIQQRRINIKTAEWFDNCKLRNIKIDGKIEEQTENLTEYVQKLAEELGCRKVQRDQILVAERVGKYQQQQTARGYPPRPRPILVTFSSVDVRNDLYYARTKLKGVANQYKNIYINDDICLETRRARDDYRSVAAVAKTAGHSVRIHSDGVIINERKYRHDETHLLPEGCTLEDAKTIVKGGEIYFHSQHSFLSNFYPAPITVNGTNYPTAEHLYQATKSLECGDRNAAREVRQSLSALDAKRVADRVKTTPEWNQKKDQTLQKILSEKFTQNPHLADRLLETGEKVLNEATADYHFGIGATLHSNLIGSKTYKGDNVLGKLLAKVRTQLRKESTTPTTT